MRCETVTIGGLVDEALGAGIGSGASVVLAVDGSPIVDHHAGTVRRWDAPGVASTTEHPPVGPSTRFDLASVTKPIVAAALLAELTDRGLDASLPAAELLPEFREPALRTVRIAELLSHTAGFAPEWHDREADPGAGRFRAGARPVAPGGTGHRYSCVGFIWAGLAAEALAGAPLDAVVRDRVLEPLGMRDTGFRPHPGLRGRIAATEWQPGRGLVHGEVHDETAAALGGVSGNAGLFGTAADLLRFAEALRTGGTGGPGLAPAVIEALTTPVALPDDPGFRQALGPRLDEPWMRGLGPATAGHTGFTGTAFATEPGGRRSLVVLLNRVHPTRESEAIHAFRARVARAAGR
ncbi:beta-lactamase family protein [Agromyces mediolanus]|uniref:serine hydrolase domain-containing protein n=1 Tax=Agromyces mediolanus TaxID=41986 RepID=UPI0020401C05|nr:serine hydrolase domain-containing protein [Agromyces mediolanus]MCM3657983.1 beta-lactamase family protein [Agromyces mediolanus]